MRSMHLLTAALVLLSAVSTGLAAEITGEYLEARTCDVYTGPCFANAEMELAGKEALLAWKVDQGSWKGVSLDGLGRGVGRQFPGNSWLRRRLPHESREN